MKTVVLLTRTRWTEPPRIRHQLARQLARFYRVLFVETPTTWNDKYDTKTQEVERNIIRCTLSNRWTLPVKLRHYIPPVNWVYNRLLAKELAGLLKSFDKSELVLVNFNYDAAELMESLPFCLRIYVCNDDFPNMMGNRLSGYIVEKQQGRVASLADFCLAVSYPLVEALKRYNPHTRLFLPGHEFKNINDLPKTVCNKGRIRIGFMGYIDMRLEYGWLEAAAGQPDMELHLVGPSDEMDPVARERLKSTGSVFLYDAMVGDKLLEFLAGMDVLVMPYRISDKGVRATTAPNKLYQYLATGRPVIISDMPNFISLGEGIVRRAYDARSFVHEIRRAVNEDSLELRKLRLDIARENTWDKRGDALKEMIERGQA